MVRIIVRAESTIAAFTTKKAEINAGSRISVMEAARVLEAGIVGSVPVKSGDLARSVKITGVTGTKDLVSAKVGPTLAYSRRLEVGFHNKDSRGRRYNQTGRYYVKKAYEALEPEIAAIIQRSWQVF